MTESFDPYRYGAPVPPAPPTGKQILQSSWAMLKQDRELLWLPIISTVSTLVAAAILFVPGFFAGRAIGHTDHVGAYAGGVLAVFAASVVGIYFQAALVLGAFIRADGGTPTLGGVLRTAWAYRGKILAWAVVTTTVGTVIRALEERLGIFGKLIGLLAGVAWAVASFFVVPVIIAEGLGPVAAVKRSAEVVKSTWGTSARTTLRLGFAYAALIIGLMFVFMVGLMMVLTGPVVPGAIVLTLAIAAFVVVTSFYAAASTYARALIYRFATGRPVPGIAPQVFYGAFKVKRRGRRRFG